MPINKKTHANFPVPIRHEALAELREAAKQNPGVSMAMIVRAGIRMAIEKLAEGGSLNWLAE